MSLSLTAEKKSIAQIFESTNKYIIPSYQRPYSWGEKECTDLWNDLWAGFDDKREEGYFLGNIVLAKNKQHDFLEVIDGQQRLITLTLLLRALQIFDKENDFITTSIWNVDRRDKTNRSLRVQTKVIEYNENSELEIAIKKDLKDGCGNKKVNLFIDNICFFYEKLSKKTGKEISSFSDYFLDDVSLLPISAEDSDEEKARVQALMIFETINNRGKELSDADILKAQLFNVALNQKDTQYFIDSWQKLAKVADELQYSLVGIFRIYTHVLRGKNKDKGQEPSLIDFFTRDKTTYSNLKKMDYKSVLEDLNKIQLCVEFFLNLVGKNYMFDEQYHKLTPWFQIIDEYTNSYPNYILYVYLYTHGTINEEGRIELTNSQIDDLVALSKSLIKFVYLHSQAMSIKFQVFDIIIKISQGETYTYHDSDVKSEDFLFLNEKRVPRKKGVILLYYYLKHKEIIYPYFFDFLLNKVDISLETEKNMDSIGNMIVVSDRIRKKFLQDKINLLSKSSDKELVTLVNALAKNNYSVIDSREEDIIQTLVSFFQNEN